MNDSMMDLDGTLNEDAKITRSKRLKLYILDVVKNTTGDYKSINQIA